MRRVFFPAIVQVECPSGNLCWTSLTIKFWLKQQRLSTVKLRLETPRQSSVGHTTSTDPWGTFVAVVCHHNIKRILHNREAQKPQDFLLVLTSIETERKEDKDDTIRKGKPYGAIVI
jgi:hypothetical protein